MDYLDLRVCSMAEGTVALVGMAYLGAKTANFGVLGPNFCRFLVKTTILDYYVTKNWLCDIA